MNHNRSVRTWSVAWLLPALLPVWWPHSASAQSGALAAPRKATAPVPQIVARVNDEPITRPELERMVSNPLTALQLQHGHAAARDEVERLALRKLVQRRLLIQEAARRRITVTPQELDQAIGSLRRRFGDLRSFGAWMKGQDLDDVTLFESVHGDLLADRTRAAIGGRAQVSEQAVRQYYDAHRADLKAEEVRLQIIVVGDRASAEEVLAAALHKREDFGRLARQRSIGFRAAQGGDTGWVEVASLWPPLRETVATLEVREAVGPLQRGSEFLVVRLHGRRHGRMKSLSEARPEIEQRLLGDERQRLVQAWLEQHEKVSEITVLRHRVPTEGDRSRPEGPGRAKGNGK